MQYYSDKFFTAEHNIFCAFHKNYDVPVLSNVDYFKAECNKFLVGGRLASNS